jgi:hypothetical protein
MENKLSQFKSSVNSLFSNQKKIYKNWITLKIFKNSTILKNYLMPDSNSEGYFHTDS